MTVLTTSLIVAAGIAAALVLIRIARSRGSSTERHWYAIGLAVAAAIYVGFSLASSVGLGMQIVGLALFAAVAFAGFRHAAILIGLGWLLHAGWDGWHLTDSVVNPAPDWYSILCIGFDVLLGGYIMATLRPKRDVAAAFMLVAVFGAGAGAVRAQPTTTEIDQTDRPNILFIFSDDHAFQAISAYGGRLAEIAPTPNIDRLADEGMRFDHTYVTNSICAPSRAVILTGKYSHLNGVIDNRLPFDGSQQTFPKLLQQAGYETALIGKWHLKSEPTGFDYSDRFPGQGRYYNPDFIHNGDTTRFEGYATDITTDKALDWLRSRNDERPFMMMLQHKAPHREWSPALRHLHLFDDVDIPEPDNLFDDYSGRGTAAHEQEMSIEHSMFWDLDLKVHDHPDSTRWFRGWRERLTPEQLATWDAAYDPKNEAFYAAQLEGRDLVRWKYQRYMKDYLRTIRAVDESVGRVLDYLDEAGLADNTVVMYTSDQGFYLGEHGWFDKRFMYEESFRTPLLIRWPGVTAPGSVNADLTSNLDFAETILDIAGVTVPSDMQGASFVPLLQNKKAGDWREYLYYHYYEFPGWHSVRKHEGVFDGRYKLIHFYNLGEWELYDLSVDPNEMQSHYDDPDYADIVAKLKDQLQRQRDELNVPPNEPPEVQ